MNARIWMRRAARACLRDSRLGTLMCLEAALVIALVLSATNLAQRTAPSKSNAPAASASSVLKIDEEYTKKILEYMTEKYFLTELVDHLSASNTVPSPDKVLGYVVGTPNKLTYSKDIYNYRKAFPKRTAPNLLYWGKYVAHDNNRDGLSMALALSRNMMGAFLEWHPTVLHDLHESVPFLYTSTGTGPYNAWLDPIVVDEWHLLAYHEIEEMTKRGVPGVWTHGFYDGWAPNYIFYIANGHNAIGRFYETFGGRGADTGKRMVGAQSSRDWFRPHPPLPRVKWSIRNNINLQQSAILLAMNFVASNKDRFLRNFYLKSKRSIEKSVNEGPVA